jgi:hypothetical protein
LYSQKQKDMTIEQMENALIATGFYTGGLTDAAIEYYYNKLIA